MFLVRNSTDPDVAAYVLANLQDYPPDRRLTCAYIVPAELKALATIRLFCLSGSGGSAQGQTYFKGLSPLLQNQLTGILAGPRDAIKSPAKIVSEQRDKFSKLQQGLVNQQVQDGAKKQLKRQQEMVRIWRELMKIDKEILIRKMKDADPVISMLAIQVAGKKRLPVEKQCIALLSNANPMIRQTARQTLVILGRSVDFGPNPSATPQQIAASVRSWSSWAAIQTDDPVEDTDTEDGK
jgi:hypothetical protein